MAPARKPACVVLGGGGHARVVLDALILGGAGRPVGVLDPDPALRGRTILGVPVLGGDELLGRLARGKATHFALGLGGVGDNRPRKRLFEVGLASGLKPLTVRHPSAVRSPWAQVGPGCVLLAGSVVNAGAALGCDVIVNSGAVVEHDCAVGDHAHIATGALLASTVRVGALAHIGAGAALRQCLAVGEGAVVGAGAAVVRDVAAWTVVAGVPARPLRKARPRAA